MIVIFSTSKRWISRLIRKVTRSSVSHVAMVTHVDGVSVVLHADVGGVQLTPLTRFLRDNVMVAAFDETECSARCVTGAVDMLGMSYDYAGLVAKGLLMMSAWLGLRMRYPLRSPRSVVCSEFVARTVVGFSRFDPETVTPDDMLQHCENSAEFVRIKALSA